MTSETVLIADDHPPTRYGVRDALEQGGFLVVGEAADAKTAVTQALETKPDVALLDVHMPGHGVSAAAQIAAALPETAVVMLTVSRDDEDLFAALRAGAVGYLLKSIDPDRLPEALNGVLHGEAAIPRDLMARVVDEFRATGTRRLMLPGRPPIHLTKREWEVWHALHEGLTTRQMADRLSVAPVTVRSHVRNLLLKLRVRDRSEAVRLLDQHGR